MCGGQRWTGERDCVEAYKSDRRDHVYKGVMCIKIIASKKTMRKIICIVKTRGGETRTRY